MKKVLKIILCTILLFIFNSCDKTEYPNDISLHHYNENINVGKLWGTFYANGDSLRMNNYSSYGFNIHFYLPTGSSTSFTRGDMVSITEASNLTFNIGSETLITRQLSIYRDGVVRDAYFIVEFPETLDQGVYSMLVSFSYGDMDIQHLQRQIDFIISPNGTTSFGIVNVFGDGNLNKQKLNEQFLLVNSNSF
jgi:hypothetical protein